MTPFSDSSPARLKGQRVCRKCRLTLFVHFPASDSHTIKKELTFQSEKHTSHPHPAPRRLPCSDGACLPAPWWRGFGGPSLGLRACSLHVSWVLAGSRGLTQTRKACRSKACGSVDVLATDGSGRRAFAERHGPLTGPWRNRATWQRWPRELSVRQNLQNDERHSD